MIVLVEAQRTGQEHASFNAALLETVLTAYPDDAVIFLGQGEHLGWVQRAYEDASGPVPSRVEWREISIPPKGTGGIRRLPDERGWCRSVAALARSETVRAVILCSVTDTGLFLLNTLLRFRPSRVPLLVVMHSSLSAIAEPYRRKPWNWFCDFRQLLRSRQPARLRYVALGSAIYQAVCELLPRAAESFVSLDLPCLWVRHAVAERSPDPCVRFGFFGAPRPGTGFELFCQLATDMRGYIADGRCEFVLVGFLSKDAPDYATDNVAGVSREPLPMEEYSRRGDAITYSIWAGDPAKYRLTASASFVDTLSYIKPGIFLKAPYVKSYCDQMGDSGYLCDDYEGMLRVATSLVEGFPQERYSAQCGNILRTREMCSPQVLGPQLREIVERIR